jgi:hypothetical protein
VQGSGFRCFHRLRVRWAEVDLQKIVFNYLDLTSIDTAMSDDRPCLALPRRAVRGSKQGSITSPCTSR